MGLNWKEEQYYFNGLISNSSDCLLQQIKLFNLSETHKNLSFLNKIVLFYNNIKSAQSENEYLNCFYNSLNKNIEICKELCYKLNLPMNFKFKESINILNIFINKPYYYSIYTNNIIDSKLVKDEDINKYIKDILESNKHLIYIKRSIDKKNQNIYSYVTDNIKIFSNDVLKLYINNKF